MPIGSRERPNVVDSVESVRHCAMDIQFWMDIQAMDIHFAMAILRQFAHFGGLGPGLVAFEACESLRPTRRHRRLSPGNLWFGISR